MPYEFTMQRRVQFAETDAAGVLHFSNFFRYMEEAEHAFCRSLGAAAYRSDAEGIEGLPRVAVSCEYRRPVRYPEVVEVRLLVRDITEKSVGYEVVFAVEDEGREGRREVARGTMRVVHVARSHGSSDWRTRRLPRALREGLVVAPPEAGARPGSG